MPIKVLKQIVAQFKKSSECPYCKSRFKEDDVSVLASTGHTCILFVCCTACNANAFVTVELFPDEIRMHIMPGEEISTNEILDMKNFLKSWQGDLKDLFKK